MKLRIPFIALLAVFIIGGMVYTAAANAQNARDNQLLYELLQRIELLERELRQLRGDFELLQYQQRQSPDAAGRGDISLQEIEQRLLQLEQNSGGSRISESFPSSPPSSSQTFSGATTDNPPTSTIIQSDPAGSAATAPVESLLPPVPSSGPQLQSRNALADLPEAEQEGYNVALERLRAGQYQQAINDFRAFIDTYPNSSLNDNAYYWLGEAYYISRDFDNAKQTYLALGSQYPSSEKLPDTLLKLGYVYSELGDYEKSKQVLNKLIEAFPGSNAANLAEKHLRLLR